jgi:hypothetical protein
LPENLNGLVNWPIFAKFSATKVFFVKVAELANALDLGLKNYPK